MSFDSVILTKLKGFNIVKAVVMYVTILFNKFTKIEIQSKFTIVLGNCTKLLGVDYVLGVRLQADQTNRRFRRVRYHTTRW